MHGIIYLMTDSTNKSLTYLFIVFVIYFIAFLVMHLITCKMQKLRQIKEAELLKDIVNDNIKEGNEEKNDYIDKFVEKNKKKERLSFKLSKIIIIVFIGLVIFAFISNGKVFDNQYLALVYYIFPLISFDTISSGYEYLKKTKKS